MCVVFYLGAGGSGGQEGDGEKRHWRSVQRGLRVDGVCVTQYPGRVWHGVMGMPGTVPVSTEQSGQYTLETGN